MLFSWIHLGMWRHLACAQNVHCLYSIRAFSSQLPRPARAFRYGRRRKCISTSGPSKSIPQKMCISREGSRWSNSLGNIYSVVVPGHRELGSAPSPRLGAVVLEPHRSLLESTPSLCSLLLLPLLHSVSLNTFVSHLDSHILTSLRHISYFSESITSDAVAGIPGSR